MEHIKRFIKSLETEIEQLKCDIFYVTNDVSSRALERSIQNRKDRIKELRKNTSNRNS